jgi:uncharacterized protein
MNINKGSSNSLTPDEGKDQLSATDRLTLLKLARQAMVDGVNGKPLTPLDIESFSLQLRENGASFVTLSKQGGLRGCIGALEAYQPLVEDVREHAVAAAVQDYRFTPVTTDELSAIEIEISRLTPPRRYEYHDPSDLISNLRPGIDGVVLKDGRYRATFLPQVWEKVPDPTIFLNMLCQKMGAPSNLWRRKLLEVYIYQVEEFHE